MNWRPDPADFKVFDLRETVTFVKVAPDGTTTSYGGVDALPVPLVAANVTDAGGAQMTPQTVNWHLKLSDLPAGVIPDRGDRVVSVSVFYAGTWVVRDGDAAVDRVSAVVRTQKLIS